MHTLAHSLGVTEGSLLSEGTEARERVLALLDERGVRITTVRQAERIADLVADAIAKEQTTGT